MLAIFGGNAEIRLKFKMASTFVEWRGFENVASIFDACSPGC